MAAVLDGDAVRKHLQEDLPKAWGARVDERMRTLGMRNVQLAVRANTTAQTISKVRAGELVPRDYLRVMIAAALATTPEQLFPMPTMAEIQRLAAA